MQGHICIHICIHIWCIHIWPCICRVFSLARECRVVKTIAMPYFCRFSFRQRALQLVANLQKEFCNIRQHNTWVMGHDSSTPETWHSQSSWRHSFMSVTWLIHTWDMTHGYVKYDTDITHSYMKHDTDQKQHIKVRDVPRSCVGHDSSTPETWRIDTTDMTQTSFIHMWDMTRMRHHTSKFVTLLVRPWDMTHPYLRHDALTCKYDTDITHSYVRYDTDQTQHIKVCACDMTHPHPRHDALTRKYDTDTTHSYVQHDTFHQHLENMMECVMLHWWNVSCSPNIWRTKYLENMIIWRTWLGWSKHVKICGITHSFVGHETFRTHSSVGHDFDRQNLWHHSFICVTCHRPRSCMCGTWKIPHSFIGGTWIWHRPH